MCSCVTEFWILKAALNFGPFKTISVTTYTVASSLVFGRGDTSGICTSCQAMILIKKVQASKTTTKNRRKNKSIQNSYWQTTQWNIWRILKSLFLSHWQSLPPFIFGIPTACLETTKSTVTQHNNCSSLSSHTS